MRNRWSILGLVVAAMASGCVSYEPRPLDARAELAALASRRLPDVVTVRGDGQRPDQAAPAFDPTDGLNEDEAVAVALTLNPDLQVARAAIGESQALLITAKVLPNPEVGLGFRNGFNGTPGFVLDADLLFELLKPGERSARVGVANAKSNASCVEVLVKEYDLATEVRRQVLTVLVAEHQSALLGDEVALRQHAADLVGQRRGVGEGNDLDVSAAGLELAQVQRERRLASAELERARLELNRLMGLPPSYQVRLSDSGKPLRVAILDDPSDTELQERMLAGRLDLRSKEAEYRAAEEELRLAVSRQYPRIKIGPSVEHDGVTDNYVGLGATLELPIFDRNQGGIAAATAARERTHAEYTALLHRLTAASFAARTRARAAKAEIDAEERDILPLLNRNQDLSRAAFEARELNVLDWVTAQERALRTRRAYLDSVVAYRLAILDLDAATGLAITRPPSEPNTQPPTPSTDRTPGPKAQE
jgi:cobalt-zinc-cadmium efflux system outer membrane protein